MKAGERALVKYNELNEEKAAANNVFGVAVKPSQHYELKRERKKQKSKRRTGLQELWKETPK